VGRAAFLVIFLLASSLAAQNRYALILEDDPVALHFNREAMDSAEAVDYRAQIESRQQTLRAVLASRSVTVSGSASRVLNAVFVITPPSRVDELKALAGVKGVVPLRRYRRSLNRATQLVDAPAAWSALGGIANAGNGIKIAILDTGIDQTHPAFQNSALQMPPGFPICSGGDCAFTTNKVIVARSYVKMLAAGSNPANPAADSRPDDVSPQDRVGHGTAVADVAAGNTSTGTATINGMAPQAYVGSYKIYGSPGVNDYTADDVIIAALDDAVADQMEIVSFSSGGPAFFGPLDTGSVCGQPAGTPCDPTAMAFENAVKAGMIVVAAAGNDGEKGFYYPAMNVIETPADAPDVIAVGASTNSHTFAETVSVPGNSTLQGISGPIGDASEYIGALTLPLIDVQQLGDTGTACSVLPSYSLLGSIALMERGSCSYASQVSNAENAGAYAAIIYMDTSASPIAPNDPKNDADLIPFIVIANSSGAALKSFADANPTAMATLDPAGMEQDATSFANNLAGFSSTGPTTADLLIKPDLVATGTNMYMAVENFDFNGALYSSTRFAAADGTSFATPLTAGAAALVRQKFPGASPQHVKSAIVNNAAQKITTDDSSSGQAIPVDVQSIGAGLLDAGAAMNASVWMNPTAISFGIVTSLPQTKQVTIINSGATAVNLALSNVANTNQAGAAAINVNPTTVSIAAGGSATISVTISGPLPVPNEYSSSIQVQGSGTTLRIPYMYIVPDQLPGNLIQLGSDFNGTVGAAQDPSTLAVKLVDDFGAPIPGAKISYTASNGASIQGASATTDNYGIAMASAMLGSQPGSYTYTASASGMQITFHGLARVQPSISSVANAATLDATQPVAPGSYITIKGTGLSDTTDKAVTAALPVSIDDAFVGFDLPSAAISVPGHLSYASPGQINLQVPWELENQSAAQVKVTIGFSYGSVVNVTLANYAPAFFEISPGVVAAEDASGNIINSSNPATAGATITLFANGLGPVTNQPASGSPALASPLSETTTQPVVMFDDQQGSVSFNGLVPGTPALYQINLAVPSGLSAGIHSLTISIGGVTSKASGISSQ